MDTQQRHPDLRAYGGGEGSASAPPRPGDDHARGDRRLLAQAAVDKPGGFRQRPIGQGIQRRAQFSVTDQRGVERVLSEQPVAHRPVTQHGGRFTGFARFFGHNLPAAQGGFRVPQQAASMTEQPGDEGLGGIGQAVQMDVELTDIRVQRRSEAGVQHVHIQRVEVKDAPQKRQPRGLIGFQGGFHLRQCSMIQRGIKSGFIHRVITVSQQRPNGGLPGMNLFQPQEAALHTQPDASKHLLDHGTITQRGADSAPFTISRNSST